MKRRFQSQDEAHAEAVGEAVRLQLERILRGSELDSSAVSLPVKIGIFAEHLSRWGRKSNLTASPDDPDEILFHVMDSLAPVWIAKNQPESVIARVLGKGRRVMDVGTGAGFPGLIIAAATGVETILLEARRKRANFLETTAAAMELPNVTIVHAHGTPADIPNGFDLVTLRAFGIAPEVFELASAALNPGGVVIAYIMAGQEVDREAATEAGLVELMGAHYDMSRGGDKIPRALALWLKES